MVTHLDLLRDLWKERIAEYRASGMKAPDFARALGVGTSTVYRWNSAFDEDLNYVPPPKKPKQAPKQEAAPEEAEPVEVPQWIAVLAVDGGDSHQPSPRADIGDDGGVSLSVAGITIRVRPGFDEVLLARVLQVVKSAC